MAKARAIVAIAAPDIRDDVVRAAADLIETAATHGDLEAIVAILDDEERSIDFAIVDLPALRALARRWRQTKTQNAQLSTILVLPSGELQDALGLLQLCHGVLFWEPDADKLRRRLIVTLEGYSSVSPQVLPDFITDRVRARLIERLTPLEGRALELLGQALSNRAIARELEVPESVAKSLVRTVLTRLRLKNRTEAAVLAARWSGTPTGSARAGESGREQIAS